MKRRYVSDWSDLCSFYHSIFERNFELTNCLTYLFERRGFLKSNRNLPPPNLPCFHKKIGIMILAFCECQKLQNKSSFQLRARDLRFSCRTVSRSLG